MRKILAFSPIALICIAVLWAFFHAEPHQELLAPEAQMDDTLILDHSRIPENSNRDTTSSEGSWRAVPDVNYADSATFYSGLSMDLFKAYQQYTDSEIVAVIDDAMLRRKPLAPFYHVLRGRLFERVKYFDSISIEFKRKKEYRQ